MPIIVLSVYLEEGDEARLLSMRVNKVLQKPLKSGQLLDIIDMFLW